jgi:hypothetical protein
MKEQLINAYINENDMLPYMRCSMHNIQTHFMHVPDYIMHHYMISKSSHILSCNETDSGTIVLTLSFPGEPIPFDKAVSHVLHVLFNSLRISSSSVKQCTVTGLHHLCGMEHALCYLVPIEFNDEQYTCAYNALKAAGIDLSLLVRNINNLKHNDINKCINGFPSIRILKQFANYLSDQAMGVSTVA